MSTKEHFVRIRKLDADRQIAYGIVYEPNVVDTWGEMMRPEDVILMAERFATDVKADKAIDTMHDNIPNGSIPIESFIAREGDPDYPEGAWVLGVKVEEQDVWEAVKRGDLNGFSFEAMVRKVPAVVDVEISPHNVGVTKETLGHTHLFLARMNDDGVVVGGRTSTDEHHSHEIRAGTATEEEQGHSHRYLLGS